MHSEIIEQIPIKNGIISLSSIITRYLEKELDLERILKVALILIKSGANKNNHIFSNVAQTCLNQQKNDGGWVSVEDSMWSTSFLKEFSKYSEEYSFGLEWLKSQQLFCHAWGKTKRDTGRIPLTAQLLFLLPELSSVESLSWLEQEWKKDFLNDPKLTYKSAFSLTAWKSNNYILTDETFLTDTLKWLASEQNDDFGWGPWRGHPVGSSPFCTGVALVGLLQYPDLVDRQVIVNGLEWIRKKQLPNGLWPDHYIEEGSAWCFYALTEGYRFLKSHP